jgi:hypothetical protein
MKILADTQNIGVSWKYWRIPKILVPSKILAGIQNIGVWQKCRHTIESWQALKSLRLAKITAENVGGPLTMWARRNLQLLTSSWTGWRALVQILVDVLPLWHVDPKWDHSPACSAFMGRVSPVLYQLVVPADMQKYMRRSKLLAAAHIFTTSCENSNSNPNSNSAPKCPITEPKICMWSLLLSKISYHTHSLKNGGHPWLLARLPKSIPNPIGGKGGGGGSPRPSNPDMAAGGATDAQCGEGGEVGKTVACSR